MVDAALKLAPERRRDFIDRTCASDGGLRREVERLLAACERATGDQRFLSEPAVEYVAPVLHEVAARADAVASVVPTALEDALATRYVVERLIGRGAMATVYLAHDVKLDRSVAIKVLRAGLTRDCDVRHFLREVTRTAKLNHPHIVPVIDSGQPDGPLFYVMPYMDGGTLRERLVHRGRVAIPDAVAIARTIAHALDYAHRHGLVHRDVKPENILFADGEPSLADFGIARALDCVPAGTWSSAGIVRGTAEYMSPEQVRAERELDGRSDVYSLACVLYEMLEGQPPFTGTPLAVMRRHVQDEPPALHAGRAALAEAIAATIRRGLAKAPEDRPATAAAFADALGP